MELFGAFESLPVKRNRFLIRRSYTSQLSGLARILESFVELPGLVEMTSKLFCVIGRLLGFLKDFRNPEVNGSSLGHQKRIQRAFLDESMFEGIRGLDFQCKSPHEVKGFELTEV